ncbi:MAG TPA: serine/threonine-protein kinase [Polyangiaceae bacterium]|jgi:serine/threonine-protein kinase
MQSPEPTIAADPPVLGGRYTVEQYLDKGGTSNVFLGRDLTSNERVVIKVLSEEATRSAILRTHFVVGSRAALAVDHPNVVRMLDVREPEPGVPYLVMEALDGELLADLLARLGTLPPDTVREIARQVASGLEALHEAGITHCDIKPENLFVLGQLDQEPVIKILDFGLAAVAGYQGPEEALEVRGTAQYMAPEQALGDHVDARTDVYALGVVMFRALTGHLPFDLKLSATLLRHQIFSPAPPPSWLVDDLDSGLERVVLKAMRKKPANRYASAQDLARDLELLALALEPLAETEPAEPDIYVPQTDRAEDAARVLGRL